MIFEEKGVSFMANDCNKKDADIIRKKAYELWEKEGRKSGNDMNYWLKAEKAVKTQAKK
jgi:Protein of unknown function (DUF2934).